MTAGTPYRVKGKGGARPGVPCEAAHSQVARKRPLLQRGKQRIERGQGAAVGGFEGFDGGDAGGEGLLEGEGWSWNKGSIHGTHIQVLLNLSTLGAEHQSFACIGIEEVAQIVC